MPATHNAMRTPRGRTTSRRSMGGSSMALLQTYPSPAPAWIGKCSGGGRAGSARRLDDHLPEFPPERLEATDHAVSELGVGLEEVRFFSGIFLEIEERER